MSITESAPFIRYDRITLSYDLEQIKDKMILDLETVGVGGLALDKCSAGCPKLGAVYPLMVLLHSSFFFSFVLRLQTECPSVSKCIVGKRTYDR